jgi:hypothetical protein
LAVEQSLNRFADTAGGKVDDGMMPRVAHLTAAAEELFAVLGDLIDRIEKQGNAMAPRELRAGFSRPNGLTDGWALLLESIERTIAGNRGKMARPEMSELHHMLKAVKKTVYRR